MSAWDDRLRKHPSYALAGQVVSLLGAIEDPPTVDAAEALGRLRQVGQVVAATITNAQSALVSHAMLEAAQAPLQGIVNALSAYQSSRDVSQLDAANSEADRALDQMAHWVQRPSRETRATIATITREASGAIDALKAERDGLRGQLTALQGEVADTRADTAAQVATAAAEAAAGLATVAARQQALEKAVADRDKQVQASLLQFGADMAQLTATFTKDHAQVLEQEKEAVRSAAEERTAKTAAILAEMSQHLDETKNVAAAAAGQKVSDGFGAQAQAQAKLALNWSILSVALILGSAAFAAWQLLGGEHTTLDTWWIALRVLIVLPIVGLAIYGFSQANKHRAQERVLRRIQLELAAFSPYLAPLEKETQDKLRVEVAQRAFFSANAGEGNQGDEITSKDILELLRDALRLGR